MIESEYQQILHHSLQAFGPPRDADIRWAYRLAKVYHSPTSFASLSAIPVHPRCKIVVPILPYDYASPSDCCYLVHFLSKSKGKSLRRILNELLRHALEADDFCFPLTVISWVETRAGSRLWKDFYGVSVNPNSWLRLEFAQPENLCL